MKVKAWRVFAMLSVALLFTLALVLSACNRTPSDQDEGGTVPPSEIVMAVTGARVALAPMRSVTNLLGTTSAMRHISLRALAAGRVSDFTLENGDAVRKGQIVGHIVTREQEAVQQGLAVARQLNPDDAKDLADAVHRHVHGTGIEIVAPDNGIVAQRLVSSGQLVSELEQLADLVDPSSIYVEAVLPIDQMSRIRAGMEAAVSSPLHPGSTYAARVAALSPSFNPNSATTTARVEFTGPERIREAGAPAQVTVTTAYVSDAIVAPSQALFQDAADDSYYVFVASNGSAHRRKVTLGIREANLVQLTSGVSPGDIVLTSGGYALSDGLKVKVTMAGQ